MQHSNDDLRKSDYKYAEPFILQLSIEQFITWTKDPTG